MLLKDCIWEHWAISTNTHENVCIYPHLHLPLWPSLLHISHESWADLSHVLPPIKHAQTFTILKENLCLTHNARALATSFQAHLLKMYFPGGMGLQFLTLSFLIYPSTLSNLASFLHWNWAKQDTQPMISVSINSLINKQIKHCWFLSCLTSSLHLAPLAISFSLPRFLWYLWHHTILLFLLGFCFPFHLFVGFMLCCLTTESQTIPEWR